MSPETTYRLRVRYNECDKAGIVFNANYLVYADVGANEFWREHFGGYANLTDLGLDLVLVESNLRFRKPLHYDEEFDIKVSVGTLTNRSMEMEFEFTRGEDLIAEITIAYVCIETASQQATPIPEQFRSILEDEAPAI
ncbi:MAG: acyl-CoA thioester hydrolase [Actinomycetota bacterium]|jgi:acyl-CoA thioester hydrolase|nr:acyl-CoA thioester hydrolase [Actinomycetota bacterium]